MGEACFTPKEKPTNKSKQYVSFLQSDTQQGGRAGDEEVPGGQGGGRQLGLPQAEDRRHLPELRKSEPVLSWVDEDGDEVVVTSDEEPQVALTALTGPVYKLKVKLGDKAKDEGHSGMARSAQVHLGVVCGGCDGPVVGPRHKCLVCPDYDLCATCEARGVHAHHKMIRLPAPCKRVAPRCHLARQVNPILGNPNIQMLANLFR